MEWNFEVFLGFCLWLLLKIELNYKSSFWKEKLDG
jgi:hypothetical protein